jgi:hypothetical protein
LLTISNNRDQAISGTLFETQDETNDTIFVPSWMFYKLGEVSPIHVTQVIKHKCTAIQIRPHSKGFAARPDFVPSLNKAILHYHSLNQSTKIPLYIDGTVEFVTIENMLPSNIQTFFVFNSGNISLHILPVEEPEKDKYVPFLYSKPSSATARERFPFAFLGSGHVLGGTSGSSPLSGNAQQDAALAARDRYTAFLQKYKRII